MHHDGELKSGTRGLGYQAIVHMVAIQEGSSSEKYPKSHELIEVQSAPPQLEDGGQATVDELVEINLGTSEEPRPVFISANLSEDEREQ